MASILVTNLTAENVYVSDLYTTLAANGTLTVSRPASKLGEMVALQKLIEAAKVTIAVTLDTYETASGMLTAPGSVEAADLSAVAADTAAAASQVIRVPLVAGAGGSADDVTVFAAGALPYKMRIMDARLNVTTQVVGSTCAIRDQAAGAGTLVTSLSSNATGRVESTGASVVLTPGASVGLFVRRSDSAVAGELLLTVRRES